MGKETGIGWCDATFNGWIGCTKIAPECDNCYAEAEWDKRRHRVVWGAGNPRSRTSPLNWRGPKRWNEAGFYECPRCKWRGEAPRATVGLYVCSECWWQERWRDVPGMELDPARRRVFCSSLADVFDNEVPPAWRADLFQLIDATPNLDWLLLTKRIGNVNSMVPAGLPGNVWIGATVGTRKALERDLPKLRDVPARIRFLSCEPLLEDLGDVPLHGIDWVIIGGEKCRNNRVMDLAWARRLAYQCDIAGVPVFFKQVGGPGGRYGDGGQLLDGEIRQEFPR